VKALNQGELLFYGHPVPYIGMYIGGGNMGHAPGSDSCVNLTTSGSLGRKPLVGAHHF